PSFGRMAARSSGMGCSWRGRGIMAGHVLVQKTRRAHLRVYPLVLSPENTWRSTHAHDAEEMSRPEHSQARACITPRHHLEHPSQRPVCVSALCLGGRSFGAMLPVGGASGTPPPPCYLYLT